MLYSSSMQEVDQYPQSQYPVHNDHDAIVTLMTEFHLVAKGIRDKIAEDHETTLEVKQLVEEQYTQLSTRIYAIEQDLSKLDPEEIAKLRTDVNNVMLWQHDFNTKKHLAWVVASAGFIFIGYYLPYFVYLIKSIFFKH